MKLSKLIFMVRFIKVLEWISPAEEAATSRSEPMRTGKAPKRLMKIAIKFRLFY